MAGWLVGWLVARSIASCLLFFGLFCLLILICFAWLPCEARDSLFLYFDLLDLPKLSLLVGLLDLRGLLVGLLVLLGLLFICLI